MRRLLPAVLLVILSLSSSAVAALPPHYQRLAELNAVLNSTDVAQVFGIYRPIEAVEYVAVDLYRVAAGDCHLFVTIVGRPLPEGFVGARQFDAVPGELICGPAGD